jgi:hypothetical protein
MMRLLNEYVVRPLACVLAYEGRADGRLVMLGAISVYFGAVAIARLIWQTSLWPWLGVPPGPTLFFDTRNVLAAIECQRLGFDPLVENPCDPWQRPMFYPRVWLAASWLGLDQSHTPALGVLIALLFFVSICLLLGRIGMGMGLVMAAAVCSPAVMLAIERGNMDVLLFCVLALSVLVWRRSTRASQVVSPILVLLAGIGKLYPIFALPAYLLFRCRRAALAALACLGAFVAYAALTFPDVVTVASTATQGQYYSYGARILLGAAFRQLVGQNWEGGSGAAQVVTVLVTASIGVCLAAWLRSRVIPPAAGEPGSTGTLLGFYVGATIYVGTFAVFKNYDYRLVYLLFVVPQLAAWVVDPRGGLRAVVASLGLVTLVVGLWVGALSEALQLMDELLSWALAVLLTVLLAASVPDLNALRRSLAAR